MRGQAKIVLVILIAGIVLIAGWFGSTYNRLVAMREGMPAAWAQVENQMQRRNDLIPNYVATVKGFAKQEQVIYGQISEALKSFQRAQTVPEKMAADNSITGLLSRLMAISITYPTLQSNQNFMRLQDELAGTENRLAVERMRFNESVQAYNVTVKRFPTNIVARFGSFPLGSEYFKAPEEAKTLPKVQF